MRPAFTAFALALLAPCPLAQTTWYVDLTSTPPGDGSQASPYVSIQQALAARATVHGDTVLVAPGDYHETIDYLGKAVFLRSTSGPLATRLFPTGAKDVVVTMGDQDMTQPLAEIEGFSILRNSPLAGTGIRTISHVGQAIVRRCVIAGHNTGAANGYDIFFEGCTITGNQFGTRADSSGAIHFLANTICRFNLSQDVRGLMATPVIAEYSNFTLGDGVILGTGGRGGNISTDPLFWDAPNDDRLRFGSPCIDTGDPSLLDPDGSRIDMGALPYDPYWAPGTGTSCLGDALTCPCGNGGSGEGGCDIPQATGGIELAIVNFAPNGAGGGTAQLLGTAYSPSGQPGSTLIRSPGLEPAPVVFGDGLRCIAATGLVRVGALLASGGTSLHSVSHGAGAGTFHYQVWVRSLPAGFCTPAAFNLSNVVSVTW